VFVKKKKSCAAFPNNRIVVYGERMLKAIVPDSAIAYDFEEELNLTEEEVRLMFRAGYRWY